MERAFAPLGASIRRARERRGWSRERTAIEADTTAAVITSYETGHKSPSITALDRIAAALGTTAARLLADRDAADAGDDDLVPAG